MSWKKWLFTGLGWSIGGPIGALLGYFIGASIDNSASRLKRLESSSTAANRGNEAPHRGPYRNTGTKSDLDMALLVLIAAVMKADGAVKRSELDHVKRFLLRNYGESRAKELLLLLRQLMEKEIPVTDVCQQIKVNTDYTTRYQMFDFLFAIAEADNDIDFREQELLRRIATNLGLSSHDFNSSASRHTRNARANQSAQSSTSSAQPYRVLGISPDATDDEVKRAYRRLAMKYHPDKVNTLGEDMRRNAEEQFRAINEAYEKIKLMRGMK